MLVEIMTDLHQYMDKDIVSVKIIIPFHFNIV